MCMRQAVRVLAVFAAAVLLPAAELPVREVVLYKHGVGYFERAGQLGPGESARLDFKASEMNDVLKSLTVWQQGGGKVSGIRYDSSEPLARKLSEFPFQIGENAPLSAVLDQLRGARVELKFGSDAVTGTVVAARRIGGGEKEPEREQITLLLDSGELRNFDLAAAASMRFSDPKLQDQFKAYLMTLAHARSKEKRSVYIDSTDAKTHDVSASYMIPAPVWKSSYRLVFDQSSQPMLEGWAIVDNTTGEDWNSVQLALVSGRPISFVSALYEPRYVTRPTAELAEDRPQAPVVDSGTVQEEAGVAGALAAPAPPMAAPRANFKALRRETASSIGSIPAGQEVGDLFEYRIPTTVSIRRNESAMLPFIQQKVEARRLLIYTEPSSPHPLNAAEIRNSTGKTLDGGPVTVFDGGAYGGEALMSTLKDGDKRLITYAVDPGTRITTQFDQENDVVREIHLQRGVITARSAQVETRTYTIRNVDRKPKTLLIEHPARPEYTVLNQKPLERTPNAYRFQVKLAADGTEKLPVTEERVYENSLTIASLTPDLLVAYVRNRKLSEAARAGLQRIAAQKNRIAGTEAEQKRAQAQIGEIVRDQDRIRQNIDSLNRVSGQQQQVQTYAAQLASQESQLAGLRDRNAELERRRASEQAELDSIIEKMSF